MRYSLLTRRSLYLAVAVQLLCVAGIRLSAQVSAPCDSTSQYPLNTTKHYYILSSGQPDTSNPINPSSYVPQERFEYQSDSMRFRVQFAEIALNRRMIFLANWCRGRALNWNDSLQDFDETHDNAQISSMSTTYWFPIQSGDTVSFYRNIYWSRKFSKLRSPGEWVGPDVMSYSVELVDSATMSRLVMLDTFELGSTSSDSQRRPSFFQWFPLASRVTWVAPTSIQQGTKVLLRVNVRTMGTANRPFFRTDIIGQARSNIDLQSQGWADFINAASAANVRGTTQGTCGISVSTVSGGITFWASPSTGQIRVVDVAGATHWLGTTPSQSSPQSIALNPGRYIVVRMTDSAPVCTMNILINP